MHFKDKVIYQIYPKSFYDGDHDGKGDFQGVIQKLDYLEYLGIDYIWFNACFLSPQNDNGYDVEDYYKIDPQYGSMQDFEALCLEAKKRNIYIMLDMVFNHRSTRHEWFQKALKGEEKYKNYYIFHKGKANGKSPTNWQSKFGGYNGYMMSKDQGTVQAGPQQTTTTAAADTNNTTTTTAGAETTNDSTAQTTGSQNQQILVVLLQLAELLKLKRNQMKQFKRLKDLSLLKKEK